MSQTERLTDEFYAWESRGRGWYLWDHPVTLEPPFRPYLRGTTFAPTSDLDDGRVETIGSRLLNWFRGQHDLASNSENMTEQGERLIPPSYLDGPVEELVVSSPPNMDVGYAASQQLLLGLGSVSQGLSFEIVGINSTVRLQFAGSSSQMPYLRSQVLSFFPDSVATRSDPTLHSAWMDRPSSESITVEFGLANEFMIPLSGPRGFDVDPLIPIVTALDDLSESELAGIQILFERTREPWAESILRSVSTWDGKPFFLNAPEMLTFAKAKVGSPLFAVVVRAFAVADRRDRAWHIVRTLGRALSQFEDPIGNRLIPLDPEHLKPNDLRKCVLRRTTRRSGMLLNLNELVGCVHLPSASVRSRRFVRVARRTKPAPEITRGRGLVLGKCFHAGETSTVTLSDESRTSHIHIIGASGTGKTHFMQNLVIQDLNNGYGCAVLDPHGDLIDSLLPFVPENRVEDVVVFDPSDAEHPMGVNILSAHSELEKQLLASDLVAAFRKLSRNWGDQMNSVLGNAILAFLESGTGGTLSDMRRFLVEKDYRQRFLGTVTDPEVVYFWEKEFPLLSGRPQAPILTRLDVFLRPRLVRNIVSQKANRLDIARLMNEGKIVFAKLAQGAIGEENSHLLGTFLVSKFYQTALSRQEMKESDRRPFFLYIDEFHHFTTPSLSTILSGARKYRLGLTLAHQDMRQLISRDQEIASAVLTNPYTRVCFRVGQEDAVKLASGFSSFDAGDFQKLGVGEAIARVERSDYDFVLATEPLPKVPDSSRSTVRRIIEHSRRTYATSRHLVESAPRETISSPLAESESERRDHRDLQATPSVTTVASGDDDTTKISRPASLSSRPGRGGRRHKYLQTLIARWAESHGWRSRIEQEILGGIGSVDVVLELQSLTVACEISVTSSPVDEFRNVHKCLAGDFDEVIVVATSTSRLRKIRREVQPTLEGDDRHRVYYLNPEDLFAHLERRAASSPEENEIVGGYTVEVGYRTNDTDESDTRRKAVSEVIVSALKRLKSRER